MTGDLSAPLLRTKLYRPALPRDLVVRPRLLARFDQALRRPLTLVCAPPGYGKTMLVRTWLENCPLPSAWLSLDSEDNDLQTFLAYVVAALRSPFPGALPRCQVFVESRSLPPVTAIADNLINELDEIERDFVLVLEDAHVLREQAIYDLLIEILRHPPANLHLVLVTRRDPPLPLGAQRARNQLVEFRAADLRFSPDEARVFVEQAVGTTLLDGALAALVEQTEGWAAGLRLAALTQRYASEAGPNIDQVQVENRFVTDYLMDEVLAHVPAEIDDFLVRTSILDFLCGPLCDAVLGEGDPGGRGQAHLAWLVQANLFTTVLDEQQVWHRYHSLFRSLLHKRLVSRLSASEIDCLHQRASAWFAANGRVEDAVQHAIAGHDTETAARLVAAQRHELLNKDQRTRLERWLGILPAATIAQHAELLLAQAWVAELSRADSQTVLATLDQAQALVDQMVDQPERARPLQGEINTVLSIEKTFAANDPASTVSLTTYALKAMPATWYVARSESWLWLAIAHLMLGELDQAYAALAAAQREDVAEMGAPRARNTGAAGFVHWMAADLSLLLQVSQVTAAVSRSTNRIETLGWAHYFFAIAHYQRDELTLAEQHATAVQDLRYASHPIAVLQCAMVRAAIHQARGAQQEARWALDQATDYLQEVGSVALLPLLQAFAAELAARQGDLDAAGRWAAAVGPYIPLRIVIPALFYAPQLTLPKILLGIDTPASRQQAAETLAQVYDFMTSIHNTRFTIDVLAMQALLRQAEGDTPSALLALEKALTLARPGGFIRAFVDFGAPMATLLGRMDRGGHGLDGYVDQLLQAFPSFPSPSVPSRPAQPSSLIESLTVRETEVLELLAQRLSAKEIAQRLVISDRTVKRHAANIYQKLGVNSRRQAVDLAVALGILPQH